MGAGMQAPDGTPANQRVGNYILRRYLTQGGMAALFLAHHVDRHEVVVAKRVLPQFSRDLSFTRMFTREAHLASLLRHPNIVEVYDSGGLETDGCYFIMEYIHGVDLTHFLGVLRDRNLSMPLDHALTVALGMCAGLHYAHTKVGPDGQPLEIVHRDVSPSNVMVAFDGRIKVMDFGVAKALALTSFTEAGTRKGKLSYMAPEQARADQLDRRADVFAIGAVLYELTTMRRLFTGNNELAVIHQLMYEERTRPSSVVPGYPPALERIVLKAVEQKPEDRFDSAAELAEALQIFAAQAGLFTSTDALGAFLREQITPPLHPAADPEFFGTGFEDAMPDEATAVEPAGPYDTNVDVISEGGGLPTGAGQVAGSVVVGAFPAATQPYAPAAHGPLPVSSPPRPTSGMSGAARAVIVVAAVMTLAASAGAAYLLTQSKDSPTTETTKADEPSSSTKPTVDGTPAADAVPAVAATPLAETPPTPTPLAETPTPEAEMPAADPTPEAETPPTPTPAADPTPEPVEAADPPDSSPDPSSTKKHKKKQAKKKASSDTPPPPAVDPTPTADPTPPKKKKKVNPTDTLLPIVE